MLKSIADRVPELLPYCCSGYANPSVFYFCQYQGCICEILTEGVRVWNAHRPPDRERYSMPVGGGVLRYIEEYHKFVAVTTEYIAV